MQLQRLLVMFFMLIIIPVVMLFANHNLFFITLSAVLTVASARNIHLTVAGAQRKNREEDEEFMDELEETMNIDMKKFGTGIRIVKRLITVLFFLYCSIYLKSIGFKVLIALVIVFRIHDMIRIAVALPGESPAAGSSLVKDGKPDRLISLSADILSMVIILSAVLRKYFAINL